MDSYAEMAIQSNAHQIDGFIIVYAINMPYRYVHQPAASDRTLETLIFPLSLGHTVLTKSTPL